MEGKLSKSNYIPQIGELKFLLILGVVLIHCDIANEYSIDVFNNNIGVRLCHYMSSVVCDMCVPCFFIISGYLFFRNTNRFNLEIYWNKIKSRVKTLFIPYIIWCTICCVLLYIKHEFFNMSGLNIFLDNGNVNWLNLIKGYLFISEAEYRPFAFAFWFIRNLMFFVILSPIVWIIIRKKVLFLFFFCAYVFFNLQFLGFEWFLLGAYLGKNNIQISKIPTVGLFIYSLIFLGICVVRINSEENIFLLTQVIIGLVLTNNLSLTLLKNEEKSKLLKLSVASTFMIYATHQCYCTKIREFYCNLLGANNIIYPIISYCLSFMTLIFLGIVFYIFIKKISPEILKIITGGR